MKVLHYLPFIRLAEGGVVRAVLDLSAALAGAGHEVTLLCCDAIDAPEAWLGGADGLPAVVQLGAPARPAGLLSAAQCAHAADALRACDIVHLHTPWITSNRQIAALARRAGRRYVLSLHGMLDDWAMARKAWKKRIYLALAARRLLAGAAVVHCTAEGERRESAPRVPHDRIAVAPLLPDATTLGRRVGVEAARAEILGNDAAPVVLFLGRIFEDKGVEELIDAAGELHRRGVELQLVVAGPAEPRYLESLRRRAEREGIAERTRWPGFVGDELKQSLLEAASVAVSLSLHENFGYTVVEAIACGAPAVITRGVAIWPTLEEGGGVRVVDGVAEATEAIAQLLADPALRSRMGSRGREHVLEWLAPARVRAAYEAVYDRAMSDDPKTTREAA